MGVEYLINQGIERINGLIGWANENNPLFQIDPMRAVDFPDLANPYKNKMREFGAALGKDFSAGFDAQMAALSRITGYAEDFAKSRILDEAGKASRGRGKSAKGAFSDWTRNSAPGADRNADLTAPRFETANIPPWMRQNNDPFRGVNTSIDQYIGKLDKVKDAMYYTRQGIDGFAATMGGAFYDATTGVNSFFSSVLTGISRMVAAWMAAEFQNVIGSLFGSKAEKQETPLSGIFSGLFSKNANGNVYNSPSLSGYSGQIVSKPTLFAFAKGAGVMGEAGPEAIMPLQRGRDGKLGVKMMTGGARQPGPSVRPVVKMDATGLAEPMRLMFQAFEDQVNAGIDKAVDIADRNTKRRLPGYMDSLDTLGTI